MINSMSSARLSGRKPLALADLRERRLAFAAAFGALATAASTPFGTRVLGESVIAVIFFNQYRNSRRPSLAYLSTVYAIGAAFQIPIALAAPHVASANNVAGLAAISAWLWVAWHGVFVFGLGGYVWAESFFSRQDVEPARAARIVRRYVAWAVACSALAVVLAVEAAPVLPSLVSAGTYTPFFGIVVEQLLLAATAVVLVTHVMQRGLRNTVGVWIAVVLFGIGVETYVTGEVVRAPYSVAWYSAALLALFWQVLLLAVQLRHSNEQIHAFAADNKLLLDAVQRDPLTGLLNRRGFDVRLGEAIAIARPAGQSVALLALDLDDFKLYNDHYGHAAGDDALRAIGAALAAVVNRPGDVACRTGGEEFAIVLPFTDQAGAYVVAERVREKVLRLRLPHAPGASHPTMTLSIGVAASDREPALSAQALYERADQALYRSKRRGRNCISTSAKPRDAGLRAG